jgi:hypothetical protein
VPRELGPPDNLAAPIGAEGAPSMTSPFLQQLRRKAWADESALRVAADSNTAGSEASMAGSASSSTSFSSIEREAIARAKLLEQQSAMQYQSAHHTVDEGAWSSSSSGPDIGQALAMTLGDKQSLLQQLRQRQRAHATLVAA